jgi:hypothetical protein
VAGRAGDPEFKPQDCQNPPVMASKRVRVEYKERNLTKEAQKHIPKTLLKET